MNNDQLDFAFVAELPTIAVAPRRKPVRAKTRAAAQNAAPAPAPTVAREPEQGQATSDHEAMAQRLESHADFRVLRRLRPCLQWPAQPGAQGVARVLVLDTETTGLDQSKDKIIELALLRVDVDRATGMPVGAVQIYDGLEDPGMPIPKEVQGITGINDAMVRGQRLDEARVAEMLAGVDLVIAHNAGFDRPFCEDRMAQFRLLPWACSVADIGWKEQGRQSAKLETLAFDLGLFYYAHRAEMDCHALLSVLARPLPQQAQTGLAQLLARAGQESYRLQATGAPFDAKDKLKARGYRWNADQKVWHTRLDDETSLQAELAWLKDHAYGRRAAAVQVEKLDALVRYSSRSGAIAHAAL